MYNLLQDVLDQHHSPISKQTDREIYILYAIYEQVLVNLTRLCVISTRKTNFSNKNLSQIAQQNQTSGSPEQPKPSQILI